MYPIFVRIAAKKERRISKQVMRYPTYANGMTVKS